VMIGNETHADHERRPLSRMNLEKLLHITIILRFYPRHFDSRSLQAVDASSCLHVVLFSRQNSPHAVRSNGLIGSQKDLPIKPLFMASRNGLQLTRDQTWGVRE